MKKTALYFVTFIVLFASVQQVKSQEEAIKGKIFYAELGGPGVLSSFHFDGRFKSGERLGWGYRVGVGFAIGQFEEERERYGGYGYGGGYGNYGEYNDVYVYTDYRTRTYYTIPVGVNYVLGKKNSSSALEIGAAVTFLTRKTSLFCYDVETPGNVIGNFTFMYRRAPINGGFLFRVGFTPVIGTSGDLFPMGAVGFGYAF